MYNIQKKRGDLNGYYNYKSKIESSIDSELKQEVGEVLNEIGLDYTTAINYISIKSDVIVKFHLNLKHEKI